MNYTITAYVSQFSRDWFLERFKLIIDDVLTELEKSLRAKIAWTLTSDTSMDVEGGASTVSAQMRALLERGLQVLHHHPSGRIIRSYISFSEASQSITIQPMERSFFEIYKKDMVRLITLLQFILCMVRVYMLRMWRKFAQAHIRSDSCALTPPTSRERY